MSSLSYSKMQFYYPALGALPKSFGWLTETGILYAQVIFHNCLLYSKYNSVFCNFDLFRLMQK